MRIKNLYTLLTLSLFVLFGIIGCSEDDDSSTTETRSIVQSFDVPLSYRNSIPAVEGRSETGEAYIRIIGSTMYYKIIVNDLDESDSITAGHIHQGSATENGDVIINLEITNEDELNVTKTLMLSEDLLNSLMNDNLYINVHSVQQALGLLRGQVM